MEAKTVWLSFDFGVSSDYPKFYAWLDSLKAQECAGNVAFIPKYEYSGDIFDALKDGIRRNMEVGPNDRVYVIARPPDKTGIVGKFVYGNRKPAAWEGLAPKPPVTDEPVS